MKKIYFLMLTALVLVPCCKTKNAVKALEEQKMEEALLTEEELKVNLDSLTISLRKIKPVPFLSTESGAVVLSDKEKMIKPDYLADPTDARNLPTLSQKYRATAIYTVDRIVADLYNMPVSNYDEAIQRIGMELNDMAFYEVTRSLRADSNIGQIISNCAEKEYRAGRANFFWEATTAILVEQLFVCTRDVDKFMPMFDDESAAEITNNFALVHKGISSLVDFYPEMKSLEKVLEPLFLINAVNADELRNDLISIKNEISAIRGTFLENL